LFIRHLIQLYKKIEFESGFNEPFHIKTKNPILALSLLMADIFGRAPFNKFTKRGFRYEVNERIVEIPFVFRNLTLPLGSRILDFGCHRSKLAIELASLGYPTTGLDLLPYKYAHPNFNFVRGNLLDRPFDHDSFDAVIAVSAVEHSGLGFYGDTCRHDADQNVVDEFYRILKPNGLLLITLPFGAAFCDDFTRVYEPHTLSKLLAKFQILNSEYYLQDESKSNWSPASPNDIVHTLKTRSRHTGGVACIAARKEITNEK